MERGALGELIPDGIEEELSWVSDGDVTTVWRMGYKVAQFYGEKAIRLERVALFLTTEQS